MSTHRYSPYVPVTAADIQRHIAVGVTAVVERRTLAAIDISLSNDAALADLSEYMALFGASFVVTSPVGTAFMPYEGGIQTADATPTAVLTLPTADTHTYTVTAEVTARDAAGVSAGMTIRGTFRRDVGAGTLVQIGATAVVAQQTENGAWDATFAVDTGAGTIQVLVQGTLVNVDWYASAVVAEVP